MNFFSKKKFYEILPKNKGYFSKKQNIFENEIQMKMKEKILEKIK